ncbi:hypothetical protein ABID21_002613 [Pseudorhizobium tarimense]|uniref:Uncharacterized protein n=1 Tax=Pseudorhizobium tarimense TaxID=1079109 RepID=A0ABV2H7I3_9HYPH
MPAMRPSAFSIACRDTAVVLKRLTAPPRVQAGEMALS